MKIIFTVGVSAAGKSSWTGSQKKMGYVILDRDKFRKKILKERDPTYHSNEVNMWSKYNWEWEGEVNERIIECLKKYIKNQVDIVICETNLSYAIGKYAPHYQRWTKSIHDKPVNNTDAILELATNAGYTVEEKFFPVEYSEALTRDRKRIDSVGDHVITMQWRQWVELPESCNGIHKYVRDESLPKAIVVDIDGTVANNHGRSPYDWEKVGEDTPITEVVNLVNMYHKTGDYKIVFLSGRNEICRDLTTEWLNRYFTDYELIMRPDELKYEKDRKIKEQQFNAHIAPRYNVEFAIDDRNQVVQLWTDIGLKVFDVGNCYDEF